MDPIETGALLGGGGLVGGLITYFTLAAKFRQYIKDQVETLGEAKPTAVSMQQPFEIKKAIVFAEKSETDDRFLEVENKVDEVKGHFDSKIEELRRETKSDFVVISQEATAGRLRLHQEIKSQAERTQDKLLDMTGAISELKGVIKASTNHR